MLGAEQEGREAEAGKLAFIIAAIKLLITLLEMKPQVPCFQLLPVLAHR